MIGDPAVIFWILLAALCVGAVGLIGLGVTIISIIELSLEGGSEHGNDERQKEIAKQRES